MFKKFYAFEMNENVGIINGYVCDFVYVVVIGNVVNEFFYSYISSR